MQILQKRRHLLRTASAAAVAGALGGRVSLAAAEPLETTTVRLSFNTTICFAPLDIAGAFLRAEGFEDVQYIRTEGGFSAPQMIATGKVDFGSSFAGTVVYHLDRGLPITAIGGLHVGCYELFAHEPIRAISDLKGRRVGIQTFESSSHLYLSVIARHVGLDPEQDIEWVVPPSGDALQRFIAGEVDAFLGFPPEPQELRARSSGHVVLNTVLDRPWSQYFCCMLYGNRAWVRDHPVATKRFLRAIYNAAEFCTADPAAAAQRLVDEGFADHYDYALQTIQEIPYDLWHEYDSEDTLRFFGLRLHEVGMLENSPNALIADGADWRFVSELKRELKA